MSRSWRKASPQYADSATKVVRDLVAAQRASGMKTFAAFDVIAPQLQMEPRRVRRLFERDRDPFVSIDEYARLLLLGARALRRIADRLREYADRWDSEADLMELKHRQLNLWGNGDREWASQDGEQPQRRAA